MEENKNKSFKDAQKKAEEILKDPRKAKVLIDKVLKKSNANRSIFDGIWEELQTLVRLIKAYRGGGYKDISKKSIIIIGGALVYLVNPLDIIPDITPIVGLFDDFTIIGYVLNTLREEIKRYTAWEDGINIEDISFEEEVA